MQIEMYQDHQYPINRYCLPLFKNILDFGTFTPEERLSIKRYAPWHTLYTYVSVIDKRGWYSIHPYTHRGITDIDLKATYSQKELESDLQYLAGFKNEDTSDVDWNAVLAG